MYLDLVCESAELSQVELWAWCLMSNHVHWIVVPRTELGLSRLFRRAHGEYARYRHRLRRTNGHLWQSRYFSCPLDDDHCWLAAAYVERNPVRASLVRSAEDYRWSSASARLGVQALPGWLNISQWKVRYTPEIWREILATSAREEALARRVREATTAGLPWAAPDFIQRTSQTLNRDLTFRSRGRPSRAATADPNRLLTPDVQL